jgi:hypothetical protein
MDGLKEKTNNNVSNASGVRASRNRNGANGLNGDHQTSRPAEETTRWTQPGSDSIARRYAIDDQNLALRHQFIRLTKEAATLLGELVDWARRIAPDVAREFYDWQFSFPPTRRFFDDLAAGLRSMIAQFAF